jgi:hypothetical protein
MIGDILASAWSRTGLECFRASSCGRSLGIALGEQLLQRTAQASPRLHDNPAYFNCDAGLAPGCKCKISRSADGTASIAEPPTTCRERGAAV